MIAGVLILGFSKRHPNSSIRYDEAALAREIGSGFELQETKIVDHVTPRARHQQFVYAVFVRDAASAHRATSTWPPSLQPMTSPR